MGTSAELLVLVKQTLPDTRLTRLTNEDGTATTVDDTFLDAICKRAIASFEIRTGILSDTSSSDSPHLTALEEGVLWLIEKKKGRDSSIEENHRKTFYSLCKDITERSYLEAETNSNYRGKKEEIRPNTIRDFDKRRAVFRGRTINVDNLETNTGGNTVI